jgi:hypothetical protein
VSRTTVSEPVETVIRPASLGLVVMTNRGVPELLELTRATYSQAVEPETGYGKPVSSRVRQRDHSLTAPEGVRSVQFSGARPVVRGRTTAGLRRLSCGR